MDILDYNNAIIISILRCIEQQWTFLLLLSYPQKEGNPKAIKNCRKG
jgi:hypothetical protein